MAILCNFVTLTINFNLASIFDINFTDFGNILLQFAPYRRRKTTADKCSGMNFYALCMHMLCVVSRIVSGVLPDRIAPSSVFSRTYSRMYSLTKNVSAGTPSVFMIFIRNAAANTRAGRLRRLRYSLRLGNASQTSLTRSSISSIRINVAILYFGGDIHQHVYMTRT